MIFHKPYSSSLGALNLTTSYVKIKQKCEN